MLDFFNLGVCPLIYSFAICLRTGCPLENLRAVRVNLYLLLIDATTGLSANTGMSGQIIWASRFSLVLSRIRTEECCARDQRAVPTVELSVAKALSNVRRWRSISKENLYKVITFN